MYKTFYIILFLCLGSLATSFAQDYQKFTAWLDSQEVDGKKIIIGWCRNNTAAAAYIKYEAVLQMKGQTVEIKRGTTLALPSSPTLLTKAIFTLTDLDFEHLRLVITNRDDEILAFDKIINPLPQLNPISSNQPTDPLTPPVVAANKNPFDIEIEGLVLDETRSKLARDFYETFYRDWSSLNIDVKGQTIIIRETPGRIGNSTSVIVEVDDQPVTRLNLQPRAEMVEEMAAQLVIALEAYFTDPSNHAVIEGDDLNGSGIY